MKHIVTHIVTLFITLCLLSACSLVYVSGESNTAVVRQDKVISTDADLAATVPLL